MHIAHSQITSAHIESSLYIYTIIMHNIINDMVNKLLFLFNSQLSNALKKSKSRV